MNFDTSRGTPAVRKGGRDSVPAAMKLFRANATPAEKAYTLCFAGLMCLAIYGMATHVASESIFVSWKALDPGAIALLTDLSGKEVVARVTLVGKSRGTYRRYLCDFNVSVREASTGWSCMKCVSKEFWANARIGQELDAVLLRSEYGARIEFLKI